MKTYILLATCICHLSFGHPGAVGTADDTSSSIPPTGYERVVEDGRNEVPLVSLNEFSNAVRAEYPYADVTSLSGEDDYRYGYSEEAKFGGGNLPPAQAFTGNPVLMVFGTIQAGLLNVYDPATRTAWSIAGPRAQIDALRRGIATGAATVANLPANGLVIGSQVVPANATQTTILNTLRTLNGTVWNRVLAIFENVRKGIQAGTTVPWAWASEVLVGGSTLPALGRALLSFARSSGNLFTAAVLIGAYVLPLIVPKAMAGMQKDPSVAMWIIPRKIYEQSTAGYPAGSVWANSFYTLVNATAATNCRACWSTHQRMTADILTAALQDCMSAENKTACQQAADRFQVSCMTCSARAGGKYAVDGARAHPNLCWAEGFTSVGNDAERLNPCK